MDTLQQTIINLLDENETMTYARIVLNVGSDLNKQVSDNIAELLSNEDIRIVKRNNIGIPLYALAC